MLGRLPGPEEFPRVSEVIARFGSLKRAFALISKITGRRRGIVLIKEGQRTYWYF
jgi:hypothetical protein